MLRVGYKPSFIRQFKKLPEALQCEVQDRIQAFSEDPQHPSLHMHKLRGRLRGRWSFSVNYQYRVIFIYEGKRNIALLAVGDHGVYG